MSHVYRWHSQLTASMNGPMVGKTPLHLHQSDLDGACGHHCALMVLMLLGQITRHELQGSKRKKNALASFWKTSSPYYFVGSKPQKLASFFKAYRKQVTCNVITKHLRDVVSATLHADGLAIIGIQNPDLNHWALAVGIGSREGFREEEKLLLLDPAFPPLPLLPWNATLTLNPTRRGWHQYETAHSSAKVHLCDALCLMPSISEIDFDIELD